MNAHAAEPASKPLAQLLFINSGMIVQELGWDDDVLDELRISIEETIGEEMLDEDAQEVCDVVLLWYRQGDGDLVDYLLDAISPLTDEGFLWILTPKTGQAGFVQTATIAEAVPTAGLVQTTSVTLGNWIGSKLMQPKSVRGKKH